MARPPLIIDNFNVRQFILSIVGDTIDMSEIPSWLESCLYSAARSGHSRPSTSYAMCVALATLDEISFDAVSNFVNRKPRAIDEREFSRSYVQSFMSRLIYARNSIQFMYERRTGEPFPRFYRIDSGIIGDFCYADGVKRSEISYLNTVRNQE